MLRKILQSPEVKPFFPVFYEMETAQYFRDCHQHYDKMAAYHGLGQQNQDHAIQLYDYKNRQVFENQTFHDRYFKNTFSTNKPTEIVFKNCTFTGCSFRTNETMRFVFNTCRFDQWQAGSIGTVHNRFDGDLGKYVFINIEHAMFMVQHPVTTEASFDMVFEHCHDVSIYVADYKRLHIQLNHSHIRRLFLLHTNCLIQQSNSHMHSFLFLPPIGSSKEDTMKCTHLYQTCNSVIKEGLLDKSSADYYPVNLIRQLAKKHQYQEHKHEYLQQKAAGVPIKMLQKPSFDYSVYLMQFFDFFTYPLALSIRSLEIILIFALIYSFSGIYNVVAQSYIELNYYALNLRHILEVFSTTLYFSISTFTTVGYGDYIIRHGYELFAALEALLGVIYCSALVISIFNRFHD